VPLHPAIVAQQVEYRIAVREVFAHQGMAPYLQGLAVLAQHIQAGSVVDLRVYQKDGADGSVAQRAPWLQRRKCAQLLQDVRRCVEQQPICVVATHHNRRLRARAVIWAAAAYGRAVKAVAIPLRKAATGSSAENMDFQNKTRR